MFDYTVHSIARYVHPQKATQLTSNAVIAFLITGQRRMQVANFTLADSFPYLGLFPAGTFLKFDYSDRRDQWAIVLDFPGLSCGTQPGTVRVSFADDREHVLLPMITPIVKEHISGWEGEFLRMREAFRAPCPANRIRLKTGLANIIRYVIDQRPDIYPSAVVKLRWLIDDDQQCRRNLSELSRQCGYSASRLRVLFEQEYGLSPQAYRNRRRMSQAADLLCNSDLRVQEVSDRVGCRHVSHFSALFKSAFGMTPSQYQAQFRQM